MATSAQINQLTSLYVGYFDRAPDPAGLQSWINAIDAGVDLETIAGNFATSAEAKALYPYLETPGLVTPAAFVGSIYLNLFNRPAEPEGLNYWVDLLNSGAITPEQMILQIIGGAQGSDLTILDNKIEAGRYFAETAASTPGYDYEIEDARAAIDGVTADPDSVVAAKAGTDAVVAGNANAGDTFTLTAGADEITGTAANDVFNAPLVATPDGDDADQFETLNDSDILDGGEGVDRLNVTLGDGAEESDPSPSISNIEQFFIRSVESSSDIDMEFVSGAEQIWNDRSTEELDIDNVQNGVVIGLNQVRDDTEVEYDTDVLGGDFVQTVVAQGAGTATSSVDLKIDVSGDDALTGINLNAASGVNNILLVNDATDIADLTITGAAALQLAANGNFSSIETVDSTAYTGDLELDIRGQGDGADLNVALGAGDDDLTVDVDTLDDEDNLATLDGGEGEDNLTLTGFSSIAQIGNVDFSNVSGFEQLTLSQGGGPYNLGTQELDLSETDFTSLVVEVGITGGDFTVIGSADFNTITAEEEVTGGTFTYEGFETATLNANADVGADFVAEDLVTLTLNLDEGTTFTVGSLTADALESMTLNLGDDGDFTGPTAGTAAALATIDINGGDDSSADYTFGGDEESLATIDMSDMSGETELDFVGDVEGALSVLIGSGDLDYNGGDANEDNRETFTFTGDDIAMIDIDGFTSGVGGNGDRIDFSQFAAVTDLDDLDITFDGSDTTIVAADGQFDGEITVQGTDLSTDAFNFIF